MSCVVLVRSRATAWSIVRSALPYYGDDNDAYDGRDDDDDDEGGGDNDDYDWGDDDAHVGDGICSGTCSGVSYIF